MTRSGHLKVLRFLFVELIGRERIALTERRLPRELLLSTELSERSTIGIAEGAA
jgi:hypothetical protein